MVETLLPKVTPRVLIFSDNTLPPLSSISLTSLPSLASSPTLISKSTSGADFPLSRISRIERVSFSFSGAPGTPFMPVSTSVSFDFPILPPGHVLSVSMLVSSDLFPPDLNLAYPASPLRVPTSPYSLHSPITPSLILASPDAANTHMGALSCRQNHPSPPHCVRRGVGLESLDAGARPRNASHANAI